MSGQENSTARPRLVPVSCAGGMARQYRVQVCDPKHPAQWSLVGSFRDEQVAEKIADGLSRSGRQVRVVACQALPTAA